MSKIVSLIAVVVLVSAASAYAQDFRSPDAKPAVVVQDYRSPDARAPYASTSTGIVQDFRSPDAHPSRSVPAAPQDLAASSDSFAWGFLALAVGLAALLALVVTLSVRRRRGVVIGS